MVIKNNKVFIKNNYSENNAIKKGDELLSINDIPIQDVIDEMNNSISGESEYVKNTMIEIASFPVMYWLLKEHKKSYYIKIKDKDDVTHNLKIKAIRGLKYFSSRYEADPFQREFKFIDSVAYIRPGTFANKNVNADISDTATFNNSEFVGFINSAFEEIYNQKAKDLIIDLRNNMGGSNTFSDKMLAYIADQPFRFCSKFSVKTSQSTKDFWVKMNDTILTVLKEEILSHDDGEIFEVDIPYNEPRKDSLKFEGNVYVLINRYSYSQAVVTAAMVQDYGFGTLIGEVTADIPTVYGSAQQFRLPNTKLAITYPKAFGVRPNGDETIHGAIPEHIVNENTFIKGDEILNYTLNLTRKRK